MQRHPRRSTSARRKPYDATPASHTHLLRRQLRHNKPLQPQLTQHVARLTTMPHLQEPGLKRLRARRRHPRVHDHNESNRQRRRLHYRLEITGERQTWKRRRLRLIEQRNRVFPAGNPSQGTEYLPRGLNLYVCRERRPVSERRMPHEFRGISRDTQYGVSPERARPRDTAILRDQRPLLLRTRARDIRLHER